MEGNDYNFSDERDIEKIKVQPNESEYCPHNGKKRNNSLRTFKELVEDFTPLDFIVDGLLPDAGWSLLVGLPGIGKSTFAIQLCAALHEGLDFLGMTTRQRKCLYIQADTPTSIFREQVRKIAPDSAAWTLIDVPNAVLDSSPYIDILHGIIRYVKPGFMVFDALNSLTAKDINTKASLLAISIMDSLAKVHGKSIPWMLLHHPTKNSASRGVNSASGFGGIAASCAQHFSLMGNRLKIEKGKLSAKRSLNLMKDPMGLWYREEGDDDNELSGMHLRR